MLVTNYGDYIFKKCLTHFKRMIKRDSQNVLISRNKKGIDTE